MIEENGCTFLLITDVRLTGGAFYLGDKEYESLVIDGIKKIFKTN